MNFLNRLFNSTPQDPRTRGVYFLVQDKKKEKLSPKEYGWSSCVLSGNGGSVNSTTDKIVKLLQEDSAGGARTLAEIGDLRLHLLLTLASIAAYRAYPVKFLGIPKEVSDEVSVGVFDWVTRGLKVKGSPVTGDLKDWLVTHLQNTSSRYLDDLLTDEVGAIPNHKAPPYVTKAIFETYGVGPDTEPRNAVTATVIDFMVDTLLYATVTGIQDGLQLQYVQNNRG